MRTLLRLMLALVSVVSALFFVFWVSGAILMALGLPVWPSQAISMVMAAGVGRYVWLRTDSAQAGLINSIGLGAVSVGAVGFVGGFFGPIIFMPEANQGPLLGIFITGPLGFILGGVAGAIYWFARGRHLAGERPPNVAAGG